MQADSRPAGIQPNHQKKIQLILGRLQIILHPKDMNLPGFDFHSLNGKRQQQYAVSVNKNWRIVFTFDGTDVCDIDYLDYH